MKRFIWGLLAVVFATAQAFASGLSFTCAANIDTTVAGTCAALNGTIAGLYSSTFTNADASIYIQYGSTGLGSNDQYYNTVSYSGYRNALISNAAGANDITAVGTLPPNSNPVVSGNGVAVTSALDAALGLSGAIGITISDTSCSIGGANCYNDIITISDTAPLYYRSGTQAGNQYDFYSVVEHEVDEALGTSSCLTTTSGSPAVSIGCTNFGTGVGAADLFRYASAGVRSYLSTANGSLAYFSINGGTTNIAAYNNSPNGSDYGDWSTNCAHIQDAFGCPGAGAGLNITNDGGKEIFVLDAVGYNLTANVPEPGTIGLFVSGLMGMAGLSRRRRTAEKR